MTINKYIILALSILTFAGCSSDDDFSQEQSRLPLTFETSLSGSRPVTRAVGSQFEKDDMLLCYVRHVSGNEAVQSKLVTIINDEPTRNSITGMTSANQRAMARRTCVQKVMACSHSMAIAIMVARQQRHLLKLRAFLAGQQLMTRPLMVT